MIPNATDKYSLGLFKNSKEGVQILHVKYFFSKLAISWHMTGELQQLIRRANQFVFSNEIECSTAGLRMAIHEG